MKPNREELELAQGICSIVLAYKHADMAILEPRLGKMPEPTATDTVARMVAVHCEKLRELAEIGRLAVERELVWSTPLGDVDGKVIDGIESAMRHDIDAYLAKHPTT